MGDDVSRRTKKAFEQRLANVKACLDESLEREKEQNDFLAGVPAVVEAVRSGNIECRVYRRDKFHAKCYLPHARQEVVGSFGLVGSSNFTLPGITQNVELNVQITGTPVAVLQEWYDQHWNAAEDVTPEILRTIERHTETSTPFDVYAKSLQEFFKGHELTAGEWERQESVKQTYGKLLHMVEAAFKKDKPLFALAIYYPLAYYAGDDETIDPIAENRQKQVVYKPWIP